MMTHKALRSSLVATAVAGLCTLNSGCLLMLSQLGNGGDDDFIEGDDVRLALPSGVSMRAGDPSEIRGDVYVIIDNTIKDTNTWVTGSVEGMAAIYRFLDRRRETSTDGDWRVYGPYADDDGRDLAWLVKLDDVEGVQKFELHVGPRDAKSVADVDKLLDGELSVDQNLRSGGFNLYFDTIEAHPEMKNEDDSLHTFSGMIHVTFERDVDTQRKQIDIKFDDFQVLYQGFLDDDTFFSDETYNYRTEDDGSGSFHLALYGQWDDWGWSGPETEKMVLDMAWTPDGEGRSRGQILEVDGVGDLKHGDLDINECFVSDGYITWRTINDAYIDEVPDYNIGEESVCVLGIEALPG
ncbi:MAG: hypothetical protein KC420_03680 [Myxococcales bacterium]|nr:hypothetical protein [Myxococcales bacterium]